jgi:Zn-dependent metalloprotease
MKDPGTAFDDPVLGKDDQPAKMDDFVYTYSDNGGVHTNSGIPNHAFYLAANNLGGYAWDKAGHIWYHALQDPRVRPTTRFRGFARATQRAAATLFHGETADEVKAVTEAWYEVGVLD